ncbi:MAG TPA: 2-amino-4-hydroxy-6-hydroxymethyldihydropteridine diphosphokinase [Gammaproteobacteria bacterium]
MTGESVRVFLGLGSNLDEPARQLDLAFAALSALENTRLLARSPVYRSRPMGPQDQPDFLNAVAELETGLAPEDLLDRLQAIEQAQGRVRERRWGPRTLDIDILLYGDEKISTSRLIVPHPGLPERAFVLYPLAELAPELVIPGLGTVHALRQNVAGDGIERL